LPDGSRVNAIIPPLALDGPAMSIRRFGANPLKLEDLLNFKAFTPEMVMLLEGAIKARLNIIISGGTGCGKTTLLNTLSSFIPNNERIVTIEDAAELRMRPDRIIIGECRGAETLDMLQAMNTGHDGSLTTVHANNPRDALARLETMVSMAGLELPVKAIRQQFASAVDLIIQANRLQGGVRRITSVTEVLNMEQEAVIMQDIYQFQQVGIDEDGRAFGQFRSCGVRPHCMSRLEAAGIRIPPNLFAERVLMEA
jgi:pilus assembly protein CpaF